MDPPAPSNLRLADLCLAGFTVGVTAERRRHEQAELFEQAGARVLLGPAIAASPGEPRDHLRRWALPSNGGPARRLISAAGRARLDAVTFTSGAAVANLVDLADTIGQRNDLIRALNGEVVVATIGPGTTAVARALGVARPVEADQPTLARLAAAVGEVLGSRRQLLNVAGSDLTLQGSVVQLDGTILALSRRERAVLDVLCRQPGRVVLRAALIDEVWVDGTRPHTVDVTVARLRRKLGPTGAAIRTVARRGYWLDTETMGPAEM
ncbi:MAG: winged helix-turn-helix domain-containing protein [Acidimicrobiales bacterium]